MHHGPRILIPPYNVVPIGMKSKLVAAPSFSAAWVGRDVDASDLTSYEFPSHTYDTGLNVIGIAARSVNGGAAISSVKLHSPDFATDPTGTTITMLYSHLNNTGTTAVASLGVFDRASPITGRIRVTFTTGFARCGLARGLCLNANTTPTDGGAGTNADPSTRTVVCPSPGAIFAIGLSASGASATWTNMTESWDENVETSVPWSGALTTTPGSASREIDWASAPNQPVVAFMAIGAA